MNIRSAVGSAHARRALAVLVAATAALAVAGPARAADTRTPVGRWLLEAMPGISTDAALADEAAAPQDSPLTATGTTWLADAHLIGGQALSFNGTSSVAATAAPVLDTTTSFSVAAWVSPADLATDRDFLGQDQAATADPTRRGGFSVGIRHQGRAAHWTFRMGNGPSRRTAVVAATDPRTLTAADLGRWTHVAASYDAATRVMSLYVDGARVAQARRTATPWAAGGPFTVGRSDDGGPAHFWKGEVTRAYAYDRVLTDHDLFGGTVDGFTEPGMLDAVSVGSWDFNAAVPCFLPEIPDTCNAPDSRAFNRTLQLTLGTDIATDRTALAFDGSAYVFDADFNQVFNPDGTPATQPSTEYGYFDGPVVHTDDAFGVTASARVDDPARPGPQTVVSLGAAGAPPAFSLFYADGAYTATLARSATPGDTVTVSAAVADATAWHRLTVVYDPHQAGLRLLVDGVQAASAAVDTAYDGGGRLEVGRATSGDGYLFGAVDNLDLWQGALTERQLAALAG
ncbi:LamG-like jellyroll fold domain-containing protein [Catellatospora aurea]|uniref:LamG-like jellyroll fold domain-containing protein n=1 Tax=Catellatospora aurea TaxID=1337874 RepID=A0ABW2H4J1_9ACTN